MRTLVTLPLVILLLMALGQPVEATPQMVSPAEEQASSTALSGALLSDIVFPPPPAKPRIRYLYSIQKLSDIRGEKKHGFFAKMLRFILGKKPVDGYVLFKPYGVAARGDRVFVADSQAQSAVIIDRKEERFLRFGGTPQGRLVVPIGIASDENGRVFVSDTNQKVVKAYAADGRLLFEIGGEGEFGRPTGLAFDVERGRLLVADLVKKKIIVFDRDGKMLFQFGKKGSGEDEFVTPINIAVDREGTIYVSDMMKCRVQIFSPDGEFISTFGERGDSPGYLARPKGIGVDSDGNIYVVDALFNMVQIFDREGRLLLYFGMVGRGPAMFDLPAGLFVDDQDRIYVSDSLNRRIQVFEYISYRDRVEPEQKAETEPAPAPETQPEIKPVPKPSPEPEPAPVDKTKVPPVVPVVPPKVKEEKVPPAMRQPVKRIEPKVNCMDASGEEASTKDTVAVKASPRLRLDASVVKHHEVVFTMPRRTYLVWALRLVDEGELVKEWLGEGEPPHEIEWNGLDDRYKPRILAMPYFTWELLGEKGMRCRGRMALVQVDAVIDKSDGGSEVRMIGPGFVDVGEELAARQRAALAGAAGMLSRDRKVRIRIESYADAGEGENENQVLARSRAEVVSEVLKREFGVKGGRVKVRAQGGVGAAPSLPQYPDASSQRVDVILETGR